MHQDQHHYGFDGDRHGKNVVQAPDRVGNQNGAHGGQRAAMVFCVNFVAALFTEQLLADVSQQSAANKLQLRDFKQAQGQDSEAYAQHHRRN